MHNILQMILSEDCINFESFSDDDRNELMFKLFKTFVIGGPICQYEDNVQPYLDITKSFYKDLVRFGHQCTFTLLDFKHL